MSYALWDEPILVFIGMANTTGKKFGGRKKGSLNVVTKDIKAIAQPYGEKAISTLVNIMNNGDTEQVKIAAAKELLDRGYGKSPQHIENKHIHEETEVNEIELARRLAHLLTQGYEHTIQ